MTWFELKNSIDYLSLKWPKTTEIGRKWPITTENGDGHSGQPHESNKN